MAKVNGVKRKRRRGSIQLFNFAQGSYLERTSRPIYGVVFLIPFIVCYEVGTILINTDLLNRSQIRVVAFVWLQNLLEKLGFGGKFIWAMPPLAVIIILLSLQFVSRKSWKCKLSDIWRMAIESIVLALPLILLSMLIMAAARSNNAEVTVSANQSDVQQFVSLSKGPNCENAISLQSYTDVQNNSYLKSNILANIITGIGAGIYEELVFRLILISVFMLIFYDLIGLEHNNAIILSILVSAALFSAHHHVTENFNLTKFIFRTIAGVYFAIIFSIRGFGITAGAHAFYDIIVVFLNVYLGVR